jgi:hypothetical protein
MEAKAVEQTVRTDVTLGESRDVAVECAGGVECEDLRSFGDGSVSERFQEISRPAWSPG